MSRPTPPTAPRRLTLVVLLALAVVTPGCNPLACFLFGALCDLGPASYEGGGTVVTAVITRFDTKTAPLALEDDGDLKDVKAKDRATFKPSKGSEEGLDKRYRMASKRDGGAACLGLQVAMGAPASVWVRVAVDDTTGLVDGQSLAFLERRMTSGGEGDPTVVRAEAVWNAAASGFTVQARVDGELAGVSDTIADATELFLLLSNNGVQANRVDGEGHEAFGLSSLLLDGLPDVSGPWTAAVGAEGLGKKGTFWFDELCFGIQAWYFGETEQGVGADVVKALINLEFAELFAGFPTTDAATITGSLNSANLQLTLALFQIEEAIAEGAFADHIDGEFLLKAVEKAQAKTGQAWSKALKLQNKGKPVGKSMLKPVQSALGATQVVMAVLHGFGSLNSKRLLESIELH